MSLIDNDKVINRPLVILMMASVGTLLAGAAQAQVIEQVTVVYDTPGMNTEAVNVPSGASAPPRQNLLATYRNMTNPPRATPNVLSTTFSAQAQGNQVVLQVGGRAPYGIHEATYGNRVTMQLSGKTEDTYSRVRVNGTYNNINGLLMNTSGDVTFRSLHGIDADVNGSTNTVNAQVSGASRSNVKSFINGSINTMSLYNDSSNSMVDGSVTGNNNYMLMSAGTGTSATSENRLLGMIYGDGNMLLANMRGSNNAGTFYIRGSSPTAPGYGNVISADSYGNNNSLYLATYGNGNSIRTEQRGNGNSVSLTFTGNGNRANIAQLGNNLKYNLNSTGNNKVFTLTQQGGY